MSKNEITEELLQDLLKKIRANGADCADAIHVRNQSLSVTQRLGKPEKMERSENSDVGLRAFFGKRQAIVSSSDTSPKALNELIERLISMAKIVPKDPYCGIAEEQQLVTDFIDVDSFDPNEPVAETLIDWANRAEKSALAIKGINNSEGAEAGWGKSVVTLAGTNGFAKTYKGSYYSLSASVLAGEGVAMERDYDYTGAVYSEDLISPEEIGRSAGQKAVERLNPQKIETTQAPVVFAPRISRSIVGHLLNAINGAAISRNTSFLKDKLGKHVFPEAISIIDDPHRPRGLRSIPFDAEGIPNRCRKIVDNGVLTTWLLDLRSARQLGFETTGHASRTAGSPPSPAPSNVYLESNGTSPTEIINDIKNGLYITELIGMGVNGLTGDYSRGAAGFWIKDGVITYPVSEITVAGNLNQMFLNLSAANDLEYRYGTDAPTIRIDGMTIAGK